MPHTHPGRVLPRLGEAASCKGPVTTVLQSVDETLKPRDFLSTVLFRVILVEMSQVSVGLVASQASPLTKKVP